MLLRDDRGKRRGGKVERSCEKVSPKTQAHSARKSLKESHFAKHKKSSTLIAMKRFHEVI